ncbi:pentatricopeptide repeat-containing protein At1g05750, chloroplastic isoform X2 [Mercurialis annua]|uniref:pentatricopeptide repeat-containing protein At1g05750, chloroplastic isoform X2 n=1 Tax=Mercurialis annua TaxID=3986 RepID=UPI00215F18F3|nr:pentatricopeptide repeat-containing protein At1g05750, chloroplastic isoform X2 [Mercurialis annua]
MDIPALTSAPATPFLQRSNIKPPPPPPPVQHNSNPISNTNNSLTKHQLKNTNIKPIDPVVAWTASISRHCRNRQLSQAASLLTRMRLAGVEPNHITFITLISACSDSPSQTKFLGPPMHAYARKLGLDTNNVMVGTALIDMYAKFRQIELARIIFDELEVKNSVSWNTMVDGYMRNGEKENAVKMFDEMPHRDVVSWTVFIDGFVKMGEFEEGLEWFRAMQLAQVEPDYVTIIAVLSACANLGALGLGLWVHRYVLRKDFRDNVRVCNTLIDMYARCGCVKLARQVFDKMPKRTLVSWNSVIGGFAANGFANEALEYFELMQKDGFQPDGVSFTGALTACSHAGMVDEGLKYFDIMKSVHKISPRVEHYGCIVDLYSRAGRLEDAVNVIENMTVKPNEIVLGSLLAACSTSGDIGLAERLMKYLDDLGPGVDSNYVLLSNAYAAVGKWDRASKARRTMKELGLQKRPGISSIDIGCSSHKFVAGDKSHDQTDHIYEI